MLLSTKRASFLVPFRSALLVRDLLLEQSFFRKTFGPTFPLRDVTMLLDQLEVCRQTLN